MRTTNVGILTILATHAIRFAHLVMLVDVCQVLTSSLEIIVYTASITGVKINIVSRLVLWTTFLPLTVQIVLRPQYNLYRQRQEGSSLDYLPAFDGTNCIAGAISREYSCDAVAPTGITRICPCYK